MNMESQSKSNFSSHKQSGKTAGDMKYDPSHHCVLDEHLRQIQWNEMRLNHNSVARASKNCLIYNKTN